MSSGLAELQRLRAQLRELPGVRARVVKRAVPQIAALVDAQFAGQHDPYGVPWAAHAPETIRRWGSHPVLTLSGAMHGGAQVTSTSDAITVRVDSPAHFHQGGTANMTARPVVPDSRGVPPTWITVLTDSFAAEVQAVMGAR